MPRKNKKRSLNHEITRAKKNSKKTRTNRNRMPGTRFYQIPSPFEGLSESELEQLRIDGGLKATAGFDTSITNLQRLIQSKSPIQLLAAMSFYETTQTDPSLSEWDKTQPILQHHIELLQALILRLSGDDISSKPLDIESYFLARDAIRELALSFAFRRLLNIDSSGSLELRKKRAIIEFTRLHTQSLRNWGWEDQVFYIYSAVLTPLDERFDASLGVSASLLIDMWKRLIALISTRINDHIDDITSLHGNLSAEDLIAALCSYTDYVAIYGNLIQAINHQNEIGMDALRWLLLSFSITMLPDIYTFTLEDVIELFPEGTSSASIQAVLDGWSLKLGSLADVDVDHIFLANPIWSRPIIYINDGRYFIPLPGAFVSFGFRMFESLMRPHDTLLKRYYKQRGIALESEVARVFKDAFPTATIFTGSLWSPNGDTDVYENDVLIQIDTVLLIVEAKAGTVHEAALRGADKSLERVVQELIVSPARQSMRFAQYLADHPGSHEFLTRNGSVNVLDTANTRIIRRISVILEPISDLQTSTRSLREAGLIDQDLQIPPTFLLSDLESVLTHLDDEAQRLHYLVRRAEIEQYLDISADEIDVLALYIRTGFAIDGLGSGKTRLWLYGDSEIIDRYSRMVRYSDEDSSTLKKPVRQIAVWWKAMLSAIAQRRIHGWTEIALLLLSVGLRDQESLERKTRQLIRQVSRKWTIPHHENTITFVTESLALAIVAYKGTALSIEERNQILTNAGASAIPSNKADRVLTIGLDVDRPQEVYSVLVWVVGNEG